MRFMKRKKFLKIFKKNKTKVSPAARKMAKEAKINLEKVEELEKWNYFKEDIMNLMGSKPAPSERKIKHGPEEE